jgi:predicted metal-dependent phosphotriesterase family hydrolase
MDENGGLKPETKTIVELVKESGAILGTGHLNRDEIFALADFALASGLKKLLITHPEFSPPSLGIEDQKQLAAQGAMIELCGGNLYPIPGVGRIDDYRRIVAEVGARSIILTSDAGQPRKSWPAEVLRIFGQCLLEKGVRQEEIRLMTRENPARLLGL